MTAVLAVALLLSLAALVIERVNSRRERETLLRAVSLAMREGNEERQIHAKTVGEMATRIQQPEAAPFILQDQKLPKQYISADDDKEGWEALENGSGA